uniref:CMP-sialic acid transporter 5-like n=1 Tax=Rhizophora mucronata TaxID=61149 RepID=A0A2P2L3N9_RHIMU
MSRQKQSIQQIGALLLLIVAAVLLIVGECSSKGSRSSDPDQILFFGIVPVLVASVLSGLASALCQWASQVHKTFLCFSGFLFFPFLSHVLGVL